MEKKNGAKWTVVKTGAYQQTSPLPGSSSSTSYQVDMMGFHWALLYLCSVLMYNRDYKERILFPSFYEGAAKKKKVLRLLCLFGVYHYSLFCWLLLSLLYLVVVDIIAQKLIENACIFYMYIAMLHKHNNIYLLPMVPAVFAAASNILGYTAKRQVTKILVFKGWWVRGWTRGTAILAIFIWDSRHV